MHIDAAVLRQQIPHQRQPLVDHSDERICALSPGIAVGDFFQDVGLLGESVATNLDVHRKIRAYVEGRVNVDQFQPALLFNLLAQRAVFQAGKDELVVAPDELIGPTLELAATFVKKQSL